MYKKGFIAIILLSIIMQTLFFFAFSNIGLKLVRIVTINTSGTEKTFSSNKSNHFGALIEVTEDEYSKNRSGRDIDNRDDQNIKTLSFSEVSRITKGGTSYSYKETLLKGYWYHRYVATFGGFNIFYYKEPYIETSYSLVYIKIINDTTIKIKTGKGETTYTVTSYTFKQV